MIARVRVERNPETAARVLNQREYKVAVRWWHLAGGEDEMTGKHCPSRVNVQQTHLRVWCNTTPLAVTFS